MKIAILTRPRTFSTAIGKSLAHKHAAPYLGEIYVTPWLEIKNYYHLRRNHDLQKSVLHLKSRLEEYTNIIFSNEKCVTKIFPNMLHFPLSIVKENESFSTVKDKIIFDLSILRLEQYDQIYCLERDFKSSLYSWLYSQKVEHFHRKKTDKKIFQTVTLDRLYFDIARFFTVEYFLYEKMKTYLLEKNISFSTIEEKDFSTYIDESVLDTTYSNINYKENITNIQEIESFVDEWFVTCKENTKDWFFY